MAAKYSLNPFSPRVKGRSWDHTGCISLPNLSCFVYFYITSTSWIHIIMPTIQHFLGIFISMISSRVIFVTSLDVSHVHLEAGPGLAHRTTPLASVESRLSVIHWLIDWRLKSLTPDDTFNCQVVIVYRVRLASNNRLHWVAVLLS